MAFSLSLADQCLLEGFNATLDVARRKLTVIMDQNADNVGESFFGVLTPGAPLDVQTELGSDLRYLATADVRASDDPLLESQARMQDDGGTVWKVIRVDRSSASPVNKYVLVKVEAGLDS